MSDKSGKSEKIYCANCIHCKLFNARTDDGQTIQKVRCAAGHWRKKLGDEKFYKYFTITRRTANNCSDYDPMGDSRAFMRELKRVLSSEEDSYQVD